MIYWHGSEREWTKVTRPVVGMPSSNGGFNLVFVNTHGATMAAHKAQVFVGSIAICGSVGYIVRDRM